MSRYRAAAWVFFSGAEEEAAGGRPDLIETSRVGAAPGLRIVAALDGADRQEEERLDRRVLLAGLEGELGIAVRVTEAHARVHLQDVVAHAEQQVSPLGVERDAGFELLDLPLEPGHRDRGVLVLPVLPAQGLVAHHDHAQEQQAEAQERQGLPAASVADDDRPRLRVLPRMIHQMPQRTVGEIARPAGLLIPDHGLPPGPKYLLPRRAKRRSAFL